MEFPAHPDCRECKLHVNAKSIGVPTVRYVSGVQGGDALVVLGQQPGQVEDETGLPFMGPSGRMLKEDYLGPILKRLPGLTVYLTNTARCFASALPDSALKCFQLHTVPDLHEIAQHHKRIILLCTGAPAAKAVGRYILKRKWTLKQAMREQPVHEMLPTIEIGKFGGTPIYGHSSMDCFSVHIFATYHPAALLRGDRAKAGPVADHMELLYRFLTDDMPMPVEPNIIAYRPPRATDTRMISLDIESYGAIEGFPKQGKEIPGSFIAAVAPAKYKVAIKDIVQTVAITLIEEESCQITPNSMPSNSGEPYSTISLPIPSSLQGGIASSEKCATPPSKQPTKRQLKDVSSEKLPASAWPSQPASSGSAAEQTISSSCITWNALPSLTTIATMVPGETMIFQMNQKDHQRCLWKWLIHTRVILGMNLIFDLTWMRAGSPVLRRLLKGSHCLIDVSVLNSLDSEQRPERGLKDLGRILLAYEHRDPLGSGQRFNSQSDPELLAYNATDSTVTVLAARELARRILARSTP